MPTRSSARRPPPKKLAEEGGSAASVSDDNDAAVTTPGDQVIQLCEELNVLLCLLCPAAIKPGTDQVRHHYRNRHRTVGAQLQEVTAFATSFSPSGSQPRALQDPTEKDMELPVDGSPPIAELEVYAGFSCKSCRHLTRDRSNRDRHQILAKHNEEEHEEGESSSQRRNWESVMLQSLRRASTRKILDRRDGANPPRQPWKQPK
jgi:hypothetical protein